MSQSSFDTGATRLKDQDAKRDLPAEWAQLLRSMLSIRFFEDQVKGLFGSGLVRGSTHLCQGQEAVPVGVCSLLTPGDAMTCTYRGHGAVLAAGAAMDASFAEILGREGGLCGGKGGSMHLADLAKGIIGSNAVVGAQLPIAVGAGLAAQHKKTGKLSVAFTGDGSTNIGAFHESLNLAAVWRLPVVVVIENNHYGEYSPLAATTAITRLCERAVAYGIPGVLVDGNDLLAVREVAAEAFARARAGDGPTLIEADTYRHEGHSRSDPAKYRPEGELEQWLARDPIPRFEELVRVSGAASGEELESLRAEVATEVRAALERAKSWPEPSLDRLYEDVYR
ncbi:MAG: thiamine pyrophosphate-dependent dehydrogenase E1 component subunit alpha [Acidimicrobiales bacterium]